MVHDKTVIAVILLRTYRPLNSVNLVVILVIQIIHRVVIEFTLNVQHLNFFLCSPPFHNAHRYPPPLLVGVLPLYAIASEISRIDTPSLFPVRCKCRLSVLLTHNFKCTVMMTFLPFCALYHIQQTASGVWHTYSMSKFFSSYNLLDPPSATSSDFVVVERIQSFLIYTSYSPPSFIPELLTLKYSCNALLWRNLHNITSQSPFVKFLLLLPYSLGLCSSRTVFCLLIWLPVMPHNRRACFLLLNSPSPSFQSPFLLLLHHFAIHIHTPPAQKETWNRKAQNIKGRQPPNAHFLYFNAVVISNTLGSLGYLSCSHRHTHQRCGLYLKTPGHNTPSVREEGENIKRPAVCVCFEWWYALPCPVFWGLCSSSWWWSSLEENTTWPLNIRKRKGNITSSGRSSAFN